MYLWYWSFKYVHVYVGTRALWFPNPVHAARLQVNKPTSHVARTLISYMYCKLYVYTARQLAPSQYQHLSSNVLGKDARNAGRLAFDRPGNSEPRPAYTCTVSFGALAMHTRSRIILLSYMHTVHTINILKKKNGFWPGIAYCHCNGYGSFWRTRSSARGLEVVRHRLPSWLWRQTNKEGLISLRSMPS